MERMLVYEDIVLICEELELLWNKGHPEEGRIEAR